MYNITSYMKALVQYASGEGNLDILDVPEPTCGENQPKVEVAFCGVCGTDLPGVTPGARVKIWGSPL
jgi:D-arabinose 1-dehydrogenase-like Zn-dependent alcohol dehydrogenase